MHDKNIDLELLAKALDISPSMHKYAVERYQGMTKYLVDQGIDGDFAPQGSFRTGTVTRPFINGQETDFDIDLVCKLEAEKAKISPYAVKNIVGDCLKNSNEYAPKMLPEDERCWTLQYADISDEIGLVMDIVPCVGDDFQHILKLVKQSVPYEYASEAVSITEKITATQYVWKASNPEGYGKWFDEHNRKFILIEAEERKKAVLSENRALFKADATVADIPDYFVRTTLQRCIQLLKRHRDVYYYRRGESKFTSVIITTLAAQIASEYSGSTSMRDLMSFIVSGLKQYARLLRGEKVYRADGSRSYIDKQDQKWIIPNPVNPDDNYADSWTDHTARVFFQWVDSVFADFVETDVRNGQRYWAGLENGLGKDFVEKVHPKQKREGYIPPRLVTTPTKPWGIML